VSTTDEDTPGQPVPRDLDPQEIVEQPDYVTPENDDPDPEVTDPDDPNYVEPGAEYEAGDVARGVMQVGGYEGARACTDGPEPGTKNLASALLTLTAKDGGRNLGIYNCRSVRGSATTSVHGEGRAFDLGCPVGNTWMQRLCDFLIRYSKELGIQCIIWNRRIWSSSYASLGWRAYTGLVPHTDHAHIEQNRAPARSLTLAAVQAVLRLFTGAPAPAPAPVPAPAPTSRPGKFAWNLPAGHWYGNRNGPAKSHGGYYVSERDEVRNIQQWLVYRGHARSGSGALIPPSSWRTTTWADGIWESQTDAAMIRWHRVSYPGQQYPAQCWQDDYARLTA
jgi:hypothetical protein